jgi:hypothetical protein
MPKGFTGSSTLSSDVCGDMKMHFLFVLKSLKKKMILDEATNM